MKYQVKMVVPVDVYMTVEADSPELAARAALNQTRGGGLYVLDDIDPKRLGAEKVEYDDLIGPICYEVHDSDGLLHRYDGEYRRIPDATPAVRVYNVQGVLTSKPATLENAAADGAPFNEAGQFAFSVQSDDVMSAVNHGLDLIREWLGDIEPSQVVFTGVTCAGSFYLRPTSHPRLSVA